jgi:hypothetical protein
LPRLPAIARRCASLVLVPVVCGAVAYGQAPSAQQEFRLRSTLAQTDATSQPVFGTPPGAGAGDTGFVSTNTPRKTGKRAAARATKKAKQAEQPAAETAKLATRVRRTITADKASGAAPRRPERRAIEDDPYAPLGLRVGSFELKPSAEISAGYDDNPFRTTTGRGSRFTLVKAKVEAKSNWSRHELAGELRGAFTDYQQVSGNDRPEAEAKLHGRFDVSSASRIEFDARAVLTTEPAGSPDAVTSAKRPPNVYTFGGTAGYAQRFNRLEVGLRGSAERSVYQDAQLLSGGVQDLSDRDYTAYGLALRGSYEVTPGIKPFIEAGIDRRVFDHDVDFSGVRRGSDGIKARAGFEFGRERLLTGDVSAGFAARRYRDPALDDISGLILDASLIWTVSGLTKVKLKANSEIGETTLAGASGVFQRQVGVEIEHAFRRWLIGTASVVFGQDDYRGAGRRDDRLTLAAVLTYQLNRFAALKGEVRREQLRSTVVGQDYTANIVMVGLRFQR